MFNLFSKRKNTYEYQSRNLSLILENGWSQYHFEDERVDDPLTFVKNKNGVGSLQVSIATAKNEEKFDINEDLKRNNKAYISEIKEYKLGDWTIYEYEDTLDKNYIKFFYLTKVNVIVFVTYNCDLEKFNKKELKEAIKIVKTIKVVSNN